MQLAHVYLNFPGTTAQAFAFYASVFGAPIVAMQTFGDTPFAGNVPESARALVMHAQVPLTATVHLMGSDVVAGVSPPVQFGNHAHISIVADDKAEADRVFAALSEGGSVAMPIANAPWGPYFGMCTDRFGVNWMVSLPTPG